MNHASSPRLTALGLSALLLMSAVGSAQEQRSPSPAGTRPGGAESTNSRNSAPILEGLRPFVEAATRCTVRLLGEEGELALGAVVGAQGRILTKASELEVEGELRCRLPDGRELPARVLSVDQDWDLALVQVEATDLPVLRWNLEGPGEPGRLVISVDAGGSPLALGVLSSTPRRVRGGSGYLGVMLGDGPGGAHVSQVTEDSAAEAAGMRSGDVVVRVGEKSIGSREDLVRAIQELEAGEQVTIQLLRSGKELRLEAELGARETPTARRGRGSGVEGEQSEVRVGFDAALQHDTVLRPQDCGGPLVGLDGRAIGLNIARAGRIQSYAIPAREVQALLEKWTSEDAD